MNPCSGKRFRALENGLIEIEGEGVPTLKPDSTAFLQMQRVWQNYGSLLSAAASRYGLPVTWLLAIATMETGGWSDDPDKQARIVSPAGAIGVMQVMPATAGMFGRTGADMAVPEKNIDTAAQLVKQLSERTSAGLPAISAYYNSGRLCSDGRNEWNLFADANYPRRVMEWNNAAILAGISVVGLPVIFLLGLALGGMVAIAATGAFK